MGNLCAGGDSDPDRLSNKLVDKHLQREAKRKKKEIKILLLGTGESGKSTIFKQMRILHSKGYSTEDRKKFTKVVYGNTLSAIRVLINGANQLRLQFDSTQNAEIAQRLLSIPEQLIENNPVQVLNQEVGRDIMQLWKDRAIQTAFHESHRFQLSDNAEYFLTSVERIIAPGYIPTQKDILRSRVKTVGITDAEFVNDGYKFKMIDVGGQRSERRKWIHVFDDVTAIIFVTSLSEYNLRLLEDESKNRMEESIELFDEIANCRYFQNTPIIIFFNKDDIFKKKIQHVDLNVCFPDYKGGCNYKNAFNFIQKKFIERDRNDRRHVFPKATTATSTKNVKTVFDAVKHVFLIDAVEQMM